MSAKENASNEPGWESEFSKLAGWDDAMARMHAIPTEGNPEGGKEPPEGSELSSGDITNKGGEPEKAGINSLEGQNETKEQLHESGVTPGSNQGQKTLDPLAESNEESRTTKHPEGEVDFCKHCGGAFVRGPCETGNACTCEYCGEPYKKRMEGVLEEIPDGVPKIAFLHAEIINRHRQSNQVLKDLIAKSEQRKKEKGEGNLSEEGSICEYCEEPFRQDPNETARICTCWRPGAYRASESTSEFVNKQVYGVEPQIDGEKIKDIHTKKGVPDARGHVLSETGHYHISEDPERTKKSKSGDRGKGGKPSIAEIRQEQLKSKDELATSRKQRKATKKARKKDKKAEQEKKRRVSEQEGGFKNLPFPRSRSIRELAAKDEWKDDVLKVITQDMTTRAYEYHPKLGEAVEYFSPTLGGMWIGAKVSAIHNMKGQHPDHATRVDLEYNYEPLGQMSNFKKEIAGKCKGTLAKNVPKFLLRSAKQPKRRACEMDQFFANLRASTTEGLEQDKILAQLSHEETNIHESHMKALAKIIKERKANGESTTREEQERTRVMRLRDISRKRKIMLQSKVQTGANFLTGLARFSIAKDTPVVNPNQGHGSQFKILDSENPDAMKSDIAEAVNIIQGGLARRFIPDRTELPTPPASIHEPMLGWNTGMIASMQRERGRNETDPDSDDGRPESSLIQEAAYDHERGMFIDIPFMEWKAMQERNRKRDASPPTNAVTRKSHTPKGDGVQTESGTASSSSMTSVGDHRQMRPADTRNPTRTKRSLQDKPDGQYEVDGFNITKDDERENCGPAHIVMGFTGPGSLPTNKYDECSFCGEQFVPSYSDPGTCRCWDRAESAIRGPRPRREDSPPHAMWTIRPPSGFVSPVSPNSPTEYVSQFGTRMEEEAPEEDGTLIDNYEMVD